MNIEGISHNNHQQLRFGIYRIYQLHRFLSQTFLSIQDTLDIFHFRVGSQYQDRHQIHSIFHFIFFSKEDIVNRYHQLLQSRWSYMGLVHKFLDLISLYIQGMQSSIHLSSRFNLEHMYLLCMIYYQFFLCNQGRNSIYHQF